MEVFMRLKTSLKAMIICLLVITFCCSCEDMGGIIDDVVDQIGGSEDGGDMTEPEKDDTVYLYTVEELLDYKNKSGQRVVIDLSGSSEHHIGKTVTVAGDVSEVVFRGTEGVLYSDMNIVVEHHDSFPLTLVFESFSLHGSSKNGPVYCSVGRTLCIKSEGGENTVFGASGAPALNAPGSTVTFECSSAMQLFGGNGEDGVDAAGNSGIAGGNGSAGACAAIASQIDKNGSGALRIVGGNGGKGGKGGAGADGETGYNGTGDIWVTIMKPVKSAGTGTVGKKGGNGGTGGNGGEPLNVSCVLNVNQGELAMSSGTGGNGGEGGIGGTGGNGGRGGDANKGSWLLGVGWTYGSNGGKGGEGGEGGNGGNGGISDVSQLEYTVNVSEETGGVFTLSASSHGIGGKGGTGGTGGNGGSGGSCDDVVLGNGCQIGGEKCTCGGAGGNGGAGGKGGQGGDGSIGGEGGDRGQGGEGGEHRTTKKNCRCVGSSSNGRSGLPGDAGSIIEVKIPEKEDTTPTEGEEHGGSKYPGYGLEFPEGTISRTADNGTVVYVLPDKTEVYVNQNRRIFTVYPDGSWSHLNSDGSPIPSDENWPENEFTSAVPRPDCEIKYTQNEVIVTVALYAEREAVRDYANMLKRIGYVEKAHGTTEGDVFYYVAVCKGYRVGVSYTDGMGYLFIQKEVDE
ncbi:MAG: hypothetical protein IJV70_02605 [Clostridia bacterium]|nr:hypothetical protein [Clostridia bacterium]